MINWKLSAVALVVGASAGTAWWITSTKYDADIAELNRQHASAALATCEQSAGAVRRAGSLGNATAVQISAAAGRNILDIRTGINEDQAKLAYLQEYIRTLQVQGVVAK